VSVPADPIARCSACGRAGLEPHLRVGGAAGPAGLIPTTDAFGTALADIVRCRSCGHMQLERFPLAAELAEAYGEAESGDYVEEEAGQRETARRILERIESRTARGRLLDLGCWVGFLLAEARDRGWETAGVEPSAFASGFARERLGLDVRRSELLAADLPAASFDAVVLGDVIEHLPDPGTALDRVAELLAPAGVLWLALPDAGSPLARAMGRRWWSVIPTHVQYFTRASLTTLLRRHGYEVLEVVTSPKAFTVGYYLDRIGGYSRPLAAALVRGARRAGAADRIWAPDFGDRMGVIARPARS
jgi:SAM-dependent methyltransferase